MPHHNDLFGSPPEKEAIRALSWKQPFGSLMLHGKIETRSWSTRYRGLVLICTSKSPYSSDELMNISGKTQVEQICNRLLNDSSFDLRGMAIAIGRLVDCRPMTPQDEEKTFVKYREPWIDGKNKTRCLFCHIYEDVHPIEPFAWNGVQGWRELTDADKLLIKPLVYKI